MDRFWCNSEILFNIVFSVGIEEGVRFGCLNKSIKKHIAKET
jgi:hypothetical protein